ncbi:MAG: hypothetical protein QM783_19615 [Phycisphaerales bacterium]
MTPPPSPGSAGEGARRFGRADEGVRAAAPPTAVVSPQAAPTPVRESAADAPIAVPCATPNLQNDEVWSAVLAANERASVATLLASLHLISLTPDRAVVGHTPRDKFSAEMALGHLPPLFEKALGRKVAISLMQVKDAPPQLARPSPPAEPARDRAAADEGMGARSDAVPSAPVARESRPASQTQNAQTPQAKPAAVDVEAAKSHPLVQRAAELLGAKVVRVNAPPRTDNTQQP